MRERGVLVLASGGATHNLGDFGRYPADAAPPEYVSAFAEWLCAAVVAGDAEALVSYRERGPQATRNHPTPEHFLPLLVALGAASEPRGRILHRTFAYGILSMAAIAWT